MTALNIVLLRDGNKNIGSNTIIRIIAIFAIVMAYVEIFLFKRVIQKGNQKEFEVMCY